MVAGSIGYGKLDPEEVTREQRTGRRIGNGLAALHKALAMPPFTSAAAVIKMNSDGTVIVNVDLTEIGQDSNTALELIEAERLKFDFAKMKVALEKETDRDPYLWQTVASKGLDPGGNAIRQAVGVELTHMPMRAEDVWRAMNKATPIDNWITKTPNKSCKK